MSEIQRDEALQEQLSAYCDGELSGLARWRLERRLRRSPELRAELGALRALSARIREGHEPGSGPDLWDDIALRLPALDARRAEAAAPHRERGIGSWAWRGAALASLVLAAVFALRAPAPVPVEAPAKGGVVRWLDNGGRDVMVLEASADTTIIWVFDDPDQAADRGVVLDVV